MHTLATLTLTVYRRNEFDESTAHASPRSDSERTCRAITRYLGRPGQLGSGDNRVILAERMLVRPRRIAAQSSPGVGRRRR